MVPHNVKGMEMLTEELSAAVLKAQLALKLFSVTLRYSARSPGSYLVGKIAVMRSRVHSTLGCGTETSKLLSYIEGDWRRQFDLRGGGVGESWRQLTPAPSV
jgi:hypothetical protein